MWLFRGLVLLCLFAASCGTADPESVAVEIPTVTQAPVPSPSPTGTPVAEPPPLRRPLPDDCPTAAPPTPSPEPDPTRSRQAVCPGKGERRSGVLLQSMPRLRRIAEYSNCGLLVPPARDHCGA